MPFQSCCALGCVACIIYWGLRKDVFILIVQRSTQLRDGPSKISSSLAHTCSLLFWLSCFPHLLPLGPPWGSVWIQSVLLPQLRSHQLVWDTCVVKITQKGELENLWWSHQLFYSHTVHSYMLPVMYSVWDVLEKQVEQSTWCLGGSEMQVVS